MKFNRIVETIQSSIDLLCKCKKEKQIQDIVGAQLGFKVRQILSSPIYPNVEIDILGDNMAIEIKLEDTYYAGIIQVVLMKTLHNIEQVVLFHINSFLDEKFVNAVKVLSKKLGFYGILLHRKEKYLEVIA